MSLVPTADFAAVPAFHSIWYQYLSGLSELVTQLWPSTCHQPSSLFKLLTSEFISG